MSVLGHFPRLRKDVSCMFSLGFTGGRYLGETYGWLHPPFRNLGNECVLAVSVGFTGILFPDSGTVDRVHGPREWRITIIVSHTISLLAVQWLLRKFTGQTIGPLNEIICPNPGAAYSLGFANCQDFAKFVITSLKDYNWTEIHRLSQPFSLSLQEKKMLFELEKEAEGRDIHKYRRAGLLLTDERWWTALWGNRCPYDCDIEAEGGEISTVLKFW